LLERTLLLLSRTGPQQASLYNVISTQAQEVNEEKLFLAKDNQTILFFSVPREIFTLTDMIAKTVYIIYDMSKRQEILTEVYSNILSTLRPSLGGTATPTTIAERPGSVYITNSPTTWSAFI
jgi:hypothetical protein